MKKTVQAPAQARSAEVRAASYDEAQNTIEVVWAAGGVVRRHSFWDDETYDEALEMTPEAVRLERMNNGAPFLNTHGAYDLSDVIGSVVPGTARIEGGKGLATVKLSNRDEAKGIVQDIRDGIIRNVSVGYRLHKIVKEEDDDEKIPLWRVVDWEPMEISAVPIPADPGAQIRSAGKPETNPCVVEAQDKLSQSAERSAITGEDAMTVRAENSAAEQNGSTAVSPPVAQAAAAPAATEQRAAPAQPAPVVAAPAFAPEARGQEDITAHVTAAVAQAVREQNERSAEILTLSDRHGLRDFGAEHIRLGTSLTDFRAKLLDKLAAKQEETPVQPHVRMGGLDETVTRREAIETYLLARANTRGVTMTEPARQYRGTTLVDIAKDCLETAGEKVRGMSRDEIASRAFHTTSDFAIILGNVTNRSLRAAYQAAPQTFRPFTRSISLSDFREMHMSQLSNGPQLEKVNEHGEYKYGSLLEGDETIKLATYGRIVAITRQVIVNDNLGAFTNIPGKFGNSVAQLESDLVWGMLLLNPVLKSDTTALFHAAKHFNLGTGGGSALAETGLTAARTGMAKQFDMDGKTTLNISPRYLLVPPELEVAAQKLVATVTPNTPGAVVPEFIRSLQIISEARLSNGVHRTDLDVAGSATAWYLAADPAQVDTMLLATLDGNTEPFTETRVGFNIDGVEVKCRHDVGAAPADFRGLYKGAGA